MARYIDAGDINKAADPWRKVAKAQPCAKVRCSDLNHLLTDLVACLTILSCLSAAAAAELELRAQATGSNKGGFATAATVASMAWLLFRSIFAWCCRVDSVTSLVQHAPARSWLEPRHCARAKEYEYV